MPCFHDGIFVIKFNSFYDESEHTPKKRVKTKLNVFGLKSYRLINLGFYFADSHFVACLNLVLANKSNVPLNR